MEDYIKRQDALEVIGAYDDRDYTVEQVTTITDGCKKAVEALPAAEVVPMYYHECCLKMEIQKRISAEKAKKKKQENYAPVKYGRWEANGYACGETEWKCSVCGETEWRTSCSRLKFCPFCGAKMCGKGEKMMYLVCVIAGGVIGFLTAAILAAGKDKGNG